MSPERIARAPRRVEGHDKVRGRIRYAGDLSAASLGSDLLAAVAVTSSQSSGRILSMDGEAALASPGARLLVTHENAPKLKKVMSITGTEIGDLLPLQDDAIHYGGQCVALMVADTLENASAAAGLVRVHYSPPEPQRAFSLEQGASRAEDATKVGGGDPGQMLVGKPEEAFDAAPHKLDLVFETAPHHHNQMEPGAIVAAFDRDGRLTVHLPTQFSYGDAMILGQAFGFGLKDRLPRIIAQVLGGFEFDNNVRVVSTMSGGAFGGKTGNIHLLLAPMAAKLAGTPVKLVLSREQVFTMMPFRGESRQRVRLAADAGGRLRSIIQDGTVSQGVGGKYAEPIGETITKSYASPNIRVHTQAARLDTNAPGWMRGPGASLGQFAIETAMDIMAWRLGIDPLDFRLLNHADVEPDAGHIQVERLIGAFAGGRVVNPMLVRSQLIGAMTWGLGQALHEETVMDERTGMWMNRSPGEALVPTNADVDGMDALIIEEDDTRGHPLGIKGMGEIGVIGTCAAIGNAIYHATGVRLTATPFRIDRLLAGLSDRSRSGRAPQATC